MPITISPFFLMSSITSAEATRAETRTPTAQRPAFHNADAFIAHSFAWGKSWGRGRQAGRSRLARTRKRHAKRGSTQVGMPEINARPGLSSCGKGAAGIKKAPPCRLVGQSGGFARARLATRARALQLAHFSVVLCRAGW